MPRRDLERAAERLLSTAQVLYEMLQPEDKASPIAVAATIAVIEAHLTTIKLSLPPGASASADPGINLSRRSSTR
jgi:hypothetical protein